MRWIHGLFVVAGLYDGLLGAMFVVRPYAVFELYDVPPPNHAGYVQFPGLLLIVFAILFFRIALEPRRNRELILYGCGLKLAYCATVFGHQAAGEIPSMWLPWAWVDLAFLGLFLVAWSILGRESRA